MALIVAQNYPFLGHPFIKLLNKPDQEIIKIAFTFIICNIEFRASAASILEIQ